MDVGRLLLLPDGWYRWEPAPAEDVSVFVQFETTPSGRLEVTGLRLEGRVGTETLRAIPLGRVEACANAQLGGWTREVPPSEAIARRPARKTAPTETAWGPAPAVPTGAVAVHERPQRGRPDSFYADLADEYRALVAESSRPAAVIAQRHDIPVSTAHRWIKEARRRKLLPPGRPGKAG